MNQNDASVALFADSLAPGARLAERYMILGTLGVGATGRVFLVEDEGAEGNKLAVKLLYPHLVADPVAFGRFRAESLVTMKLAHPNILPTYGLGYDKRGFYFQKQFYNRGSSLREYLGSPNYKQADFEEICLLLYSAVIGLRFAHESGVVHRDIKPENILLSEEGEVRVSDFGLSHLVRQESGFTLNSQLLGTPFYMSPEQIRGEAVDTRSDIYSFGIMAYEMVVGRCPFAAKSFFELAEQHLEAPLPEVTSSHYQVPTWFVTLLQECTAKAREARISSMTEVAKRFTEKLGLEDQESENESFSRIETSSDAFSRLSSLQREKKRRGLVIRCLVIGTIAALLYMPRFDTVHWRVTAGVLWLERHLGVELEAVRRMYWLPVRWSDEHALFHSWKFGNEVRPLLYAGANPNRIDPLSGRTPLHAAVLRNDYSKFPQLFRRVGADMEILDSDGRTALYYAVQLNRLAAIEELLMAGVNPDNMGNTTETPLHLAVRGRTDLSVRLLLEAKADPHLPNRSDGRTALEEACEAQALRVVQAFEAAGYSCDRLS